MNKLLTFIILIFCVIQAQSQTDSLLLKSYEEKILENSKLKNDLQREKQTILEMSSAYKKDTLDLQKQIKALQKDIEDEKRKVADLNKNKVKEERDLLLHKMDSLNNLIAVLNNTIKGKNKEIATIKATGEQRAIEERLRGKTEALTSVIDTYKNQPFDYLILSSNNLILARDKQLVENNPDVIKILNDLQIIFNAKELLSEKFDESRIKNSQMQLSQIKRQSKLLDTLVNDTEYYKDFNNALKETISKLIELDKRKSTSGDSEVQKLKYNDVITILSDYMYNYYDYVRYTYLSGIVIEIIKRKQFNADDDITDLLKKLE